MRSPRRAWTWLLLKEWRELVAARAFWVLLAAMGPLVGFAFIGAVQAYAEASGLNGTAAGVGEAFSPLVGVWAPTFSACELAAVFLLPFVAIRLVSGDQQSGALKLELQQPMSALTRVATKALVLLAGWVVASVPTLIAIALWKWYGGTVHAPELFAVALGHLLNAGLTIGLAAAMAGVSEHPSTAAILTLAVTVGTWIVNFVAAVNGGWWERAAGYTPTAMVAEFQHGLIRVDVLLVAILLAGVGLACAAIWFRLGVRVRQRAIESGVLALATIAAIGGAARVTTSWDVSEDRANSFPVADQRALGTIHSPLHITVHLAPEDPRRFDLDRRALKKLRRVLPDTQVTYVSSTSIGLFEQTNPHYGEVWYQVGAKSVMSRVTTAEGVLEAVYDAAGVPAPGDSGSEFRGHPLAVPPRGAGWVFYLAWPAAVAGLALIVYRRRR